jgi:hypothetical protein
MTIPKDLLQGETAIEQARGLVHILTFVHENATGSDRKYLREAEGWLLLSISDTLAQASRAHTASWQRHYSTMKAANTP